MLYRGTTPTIKFSLNYDTSTLTVAYITFSQKGYIKFEKTLEDCNLGTNYITVKLTQEDTLKLTPNIPVETQVRALLADGTAVASKIIEKDVADVLKDGEI